MYVYDFLYLYVTVQDLLPFPSLHNHYSCIHVLSLLLHLSSLISYLLSVISLLSTLNSPLVSPLLLFSYLSPLLISRTCNVEAGNGQGEGTHIGDVVIQLALLRELEHKV